MKLKKTTWKDQSCLHCGSDLLIEETDLYVATELDKQVIKFKCLSCQRESKPKHVPHTVTNEVFDRCQTIGVGDRVEIKSGDYQGYYGEVTELGDDGTLVVSVSTDVVSHKTRVRKVS